MNEVCSKYSPGGKPKIQDIIRVWKFKNKSFKFLILHNTYTKQLYLTRKFRQLFMNLVKKKKLKKEISKVKLIKIIRSCKEYNTFRDSYNLSKINLRKYVSIFHSLYNNTQQQKQYQEVDENHKGEGLQKNAFISSTLINRDISLLCPFCNDIFFLKK